MYQFYEGLEWLSALDGQIIGYGQHCFDTVGDDITFPVMVIREIV